MIRLTPFLPRNLGSASPRPPWTRRSPGRCRGSSGGRPCGAPCPSAPSSWSWRATGTSGSINWDSVTEIGQSEAYNLASTANKNASNAQDRADEAYELANSIEQVELPEYIHNTYIDSTTIMSPTIETNELLIHSPNSGDGGLVLRGYYGGRNFDAFEIQYYNTVTRPYVVIQSPSSMDIIFAGYYEFEPGSIIDFSNAEVRGLDSVTAVFA